MKIFAVGIDNLTLERLRKFGFAVSNQEVMGPGELLEFITYEVCVGLLINLEKIEWTYEAINYLRKKDVRIAIIGLSTAPKYGSWSENRAVFLEKGGDDFLRSPVGSRELAASFRAIVRRMHNQVLDVHEFVVGEARININLSEQQISVNGFLVHLSPAEMKIVSLLVLGKGKLQTYHSIYCTMASDSEDSNKLINSRICCIRKKLAAVHPHARGLIRTVCTKGYRILNAQAPSRESVA